MCVSRLACNAEAWQQQRGARRNVNVRQWLSVSVHVLACTQLHEGRSEEKVKVRRGKGESKGLGGSLARSSCGDMELIGKIAALRSMHASPCQASPVPIRECNAPHLIITPTNTVMLQPPLACLSKCLSGE